VSRTREGVQEQSSNINALGNLSDFRLRISLVWSSEGYVPQGILLQGMVSGNMREERSFPDLRF
jgi:hypothetical protein